MPEGDADRKNEAGQDLIRAIFGRAAIAEDPILRSAAPGVGTPAGAGVAREASVADLGRLQDWVRTGPTAPDGDGTKTARLFFVVRRKCRRRFRQTV